MKPFIVANWKSYTDKVAVTRFLQAFHVPDHVQVIVAPSALDIDMVVARHDLACAAQDVNPLGEVVTGGIDARGAAERGVQYALVGHSERRKWCSEDNEIIVKKIQACFDAHIVPILCVGESVDTHSDQAWPVIESQLSVLAGCGGQSCIVAYEPVWAIGSDAVPSPEHIGALRARIIKYALDSAVDVTVIYGGSVDEQSVRSIALSGVHGVLVGRASIDPARFSALCDAWNGI